MRALVQWTVLVGALASCRGSRHTDAITVSTDAGDATTDARLVLEKHCGLCHLEDSPQAKRGALAIFNLRRPDWYVSLSEEQLKSARTRLAEAPTGGDPASPDEVARFDAFAASELARRRGGRAAD